MASLKTLSVSYCGLTDLDGINYAPNIVNLIAAYNSVSDIYPITELRRIQTLDLGKYVKPEVSSKNVVRTYKYELHIFL